MIRVDSRLRKGLSVLNQIELLSPAKDLECGMAAIDCGADAVYIGPARFGAREAAGNSIEDIEKLARKAHTGNHWVYIAWVLGGLALTAVLFCILPV
jgi:collagenase-like PrtC family protease